MEEIWNDFRKALAEAEKKGLKPAIEKRESELDRAVNHYKQEKEKQERMARFFI
jgi:hypothetical protein